MKSELIIIIFSNEEDALTARQALDLMRDGQLFGLENAVSVTRDRAGKTVIYPQEESTAYLSDPSAQLPVLMAEAVFGLSSDEAVRKLVNAGLDGTFLKEVTSALRPGSSAILHYILQGSLVDPQRILDVLKQFKGTLYRATVPAEVGKAILKPAGSE